MPTTCPFDLQVEIPLWMARALRERGMVRMDFPRHYTTQFREDLAAGPESVKLREKSPYFYEVSERSGLRWLSTQAAGLDTSCRAAGCHCSIPQVGNMLARIKRDEHLQRSMRMTFSGQRFRNILDASLNSAGADMTEFLKDLPVAERRLFRAGSEGSEQYTTFKKRGHHKLTVPKVLENQMQSV